ncbi:winged helix-turn-helix transcriptional regulator [Nocardioides cavernaquae]|uniref:winged helix-turn-helix transcriptional regulator n=1 Tax=Nocardioides cavernaquae TaxID=2321396 RepID=UPI0016046A3A|nr:helix-turn-helix domain-containing protein [Nocardioides cavernaquae]
MADHGRVNVFASPWDVELVAESLLGIRRFNDFQAALGISRHVLTLRLRHLVADGVMTRERYQSGPDRFEYALTDKGRDLVPVLMAMRQWSARWQSSSVEGRRGAGGGIQGS